MGLALAAAPEAFGIYGRVVLAVLVAQVFVFLRLERAVVAAPDRAEAVAATKAALVVASAALPLSWAAICFAVADLGRTPDPALVISALGASLAAKCLLLLAFAWLQREAMALVLAAAMTSQAAVQLASQLVLLALPLPPVAAMLAGDAVGALVGLAVAAAGLRALGPTDRSSDAPMATLRKHWRLPALNTPSALVSQAATVMPLFAVAAHATPAETGAVAFAQRILEPAFHLFAVLVTQHAVERRLFAPGALTRPQRLRYALGLAGLGLATTLSLAVAAELALRFGLPPKAAAALAYLWPVLAASFAIFAGGPAMDLAQYGGREGLVLGVNLATLLGGTAIILAGGGAAAILWAFAALFALRAVVVLAFWAADAAAIRPDLDRA